MTYRGISREVFRGQNSTLFFENQYYPKKIIIRFQNPGYASDDVYKKGISYTKYNLEGVSGLDLFQARPFIFILTLCNKNLSHLRTFTLLT